MGFITDLSILIRINERIWFPKNVFIDIGEKTDCVVPKGLKETGNTEYRKSVY